MLAELAVYGGQCRQVQATMQCRHAGSRQPARQRQMHCIDVEMHDVEFVGAPCDLLEQQRVR
jgi:hypothetical protein